MSELGRRLTVSLFVSTFERDDLRWQVRRTGRGTDGGARVADGRMVLGVRRSSNPLGYRSSHVYVPDLILEPPVRVRARMRFLSPPGAHSALWLQSIPPYDTPLHTEVDVIEHAGTDRLHSWVYWRDTGQLFGEHHEPAPHVAYPLPTRSAVYGLDWHADRYVFTLDGLPVFETSEGASSVPKQLILSMLVSDWELPDLKWDELWRYRTLVDWVRVDRLG